MSDSSNPSVGQQNEGNETEPYGGESSASSLGAPAAESSTQSDESTESDASAQSGGAESDPDESATPDPDIHGDPDQVA